MRFGGKVAIISGGGSGIGAATARRLAAEGASIVVTGRRGEPLRRVVEPIHGLAVPADVADPSAADAVVAAALERFGAIDVVVANAGVGFGGSVADVSDDRWERTLAVNVTGAMRLIRAAVPSLGERPGAAIVLVSSVSGIVSAPASAAYVTSKAALIGLASSIAVDLAPSGIRANTICPGWVRTEMGDDALSELRDNGRRSIDDAYALATAAIPARRPAEPDEVAACIAFLASDDASYVTGATLPVDGGLLAVDPGGLAFEQPRPLGQP